MSKLNKPRLGRGLSSLISVTEGPDDLTPAPSLLADSDPAVPQPAPPADASPVDPHQRILDISTAEVKSNPHQPRRAFDETTLKELAASLKTNGVIQPIVVRIVDGGYELIAGARRLRAAKLAGLSNIPAIVKSVDGLTQAQLALVENIQREALNPVDRAQAYKTLLEQLGLSHAELAIRLGEDRSTISNHLRLLELAVPVRQLLAEGKLTLGHAKVLAGVADVLEQERLAQLVVSQELSVRNLERVMQGSATKQPPKGKAGGATPHIRNLEKSISRQIGMRVNVKSKQNGTGKLVIHYSSLDEFDQLMGRLDVAVNEEE